MTAIWLVRHAMPAVDATTDPAQWQLSSEGLADAAKVRGRLPRGALLASSDEAKAWQTIDPVGYTVRRDARFGEVQRNEPFDDEYRARRLAYVTGTDHDGWESRDGVAARFEAGMADHVAAAAKGHRAVVVASHGMAMTVWLTSIGQVTEPGPFWEGLSFPDLIEVAPRVTRRPGGN